MEEQWRDIKGFEGLYEVSNLGRVRTKPRKILQRFKYNYHTLPVKERILKQHKLRGYYGVGLWKDNKMYNKQVHRLVALTFIDNPNNYPIVNHKDGNKLNNRIDNLEWCTYSHNTNEAYRLGLNNISEKHIEQIRKLGYKSGKKVAQMDLEGNIIKIYNSGRQASLELGISQGNISLCCNGKKEKTNGYKWKYI